MGLLGYAQGGQGGLGPSRMYDSLPYINWKDQQNWIEEFIDAIGIEWDIRNSRFISASARAAMLDPAHDSTTDVQDPNLATPTTAPTNAASKDTMLDVLGYIALGIYPFDSNLTTAQKQALVSIGNATLRHKANRIYLLDLVSKVTDGVVYGWTNPPNTFSFIIPDGAPSPGWGNWAPGFSAARAGTVQVTNGLATVVGTGTSFTTDTFVGDRFTVDKITSYVVTVVADNTHLTLNANYTGGNASGLSYYGSTSSPFRPWILQTVRNLSTPYYPGWSDEGVGYSQFRAGFSAAGETVFPSGSRINILKNEHFSSWTGSVPDNWTSTGAAPIIQQTSDAATNHEFTNYTPVLNLGSAVAGTGVSLSQSATVNNQLTHRIHVDYAYSGGTSNSVLVLKVTDTNQDGTTYYWNPSTSSWSSSAYSIPIAPSATRARFACDVIPRSDSSTATAFGTSSLNISVGATSDGTSNTQLTYSIYRVGLYEKYSLAVEQAAQGERTLWLPLKDAPGWATVSRAGGGGQIIVPENGTRSAVKVIGATAAAFPYHPAISGRGYQSNLAAGSNVILNNLTASTWTGTNATLTANATISPIVGETAASATTAAATTTAAVVTTDIFATNPSAKNFVAGIWVKKISADANQAGTITVTSGSATVTGSGTSFTSDWVNAQIKTAGGHVYTVSSVANATSLTLTGVAQATETAVTFKVSDIMLNLGNGAGAQFYAPFFLSQSDGWRLLAMRSTFGGVGGTLAFKVYCGMAGNLTFGMWGGYCMNKTNVLYPPVPVTTAAPALVQASKCQATTNTLNTDTLHPLLLRQLCSVVNGALQLTVVPPYDAASQSSGVIFDIAQDATHNRVKLEVTGGALKLSRWDASANTGNISLTLSAKPSPPSGSTTWLRDTAIVIRLRWSSDGSMSMSCGGQSTNGNAIASFAATDGSCVAIGIGNDYTLATQFEGIVTGLEVIQVGAPVA